MINKIFFTPGPSELYPTVSAHMKEALDNKIGAISHRSKQFKEIYKYTADGLRQLLGLPSDYHVLFLGSATEIWERIIQNCVEHTSFHCVNGSFSKKFYEFSGELGRKAHKAEAKFGEGFYPDQLTIPADSEIICLTYNETSSGVSMPVEDIHKIRQKNGDALIFVDSVSALPYPDFDYQQIDSTYFSVQKCFGLPAGLGVWLVNDRALKKAEQLAAKGISLGTYHTLPSLVRMANEFQTPETPNVLTIFLLGRVVEDFNKKGVSVIRKETETKAAMLYDYFKESTNFNAAVKENAHQSFTTVVADTVLPSAEVNKLLEPHDMMVGTGYSSYKDKQIRVANFPAHSVAQMDKLVSTLRKLLK